MENSTLKNLIKEDAVLPAHIKSFGKISNPLDYNVILLTGLTGNLGPHLLKNILERSHIKIYCLVRKTSFSLAKAILENFELQTEVESRVVLIESDLSMEKFGVDLKQYEDLCFEVDAVVHSAVKSNHVEHYKKTEGKKTDLRSVNVLGTLKVLEFATTGKMKSIFYASSILACNRICLSEKTLSEELIEAGNHGDGLQMGYAVSKFICEKLLSEAIRRGIPCIVCRLPLIVGDSVTGLMETKNNHYLSLLMAFVETGMKPEYPSACPALPVDQCAKLTMDLFFKEDLQDGIYNLLNPHSFHVNSSINDILAPLGIPPLKFVKFREFSKALTEHGKKSILYPFRYIYYAEDAEEILSEFNFVSKLLLTKYGGKFLQSVSSKVRKVLPYIDDLSQHPEEMMSKVYHHEITCNPKLAN